MNRKLVWSLITLGVLLIGVANAPIPAVAGSRLLPPRPTPVPTVTPVATVLNNSRITLRVKTPTLGSWTAVEWQDAAGNWHLVEGWQGTLEPDQTKTWWVAEADRGKGPFRWVISERPGSTPQAISLSFYLPARNQQNIEVTVSGPSH